MYYSIVLKQWIVFFVHSDWLLNQWISNADLPPLPLSERPQTRRVASKMPSRFPSVTNKEISQIVKQAVPEIHDEGDEVRSGSFNR